MVQYHAVIGNRDKIKRGGIPYPFWDFLDRQPDGWLSSLTYAPKVLPDDGRAFIFDCGAWSYKDKDIPDISPASAAERYAEYAPDGAVVIAPDHMLIEGCDLAARRQFNRESSVKFIDICPPQFEPMATIHGMDIDERLEQAEYLVSVGYKHLALGGMAARAAQKKHMIDTVLQVRSITPAVRLHVLGLSSPDYMRAWRMLAVDSADGASHFKQAFTGGAFFMQDGVRLTKHQAYRPGEQCPPELPVCDCRACDILRGDNIDTRSFGSNENNMGRAAHNLNMLMRAQVAATRLRVVLVACCGQKLDAPAPAKDLYRSRLFRLCRNYAELTADKWLILSAKHGVIDPDAVIEPYDQTLSKFPKVERVKWDSLVSHQLSEFMGDEIVSLAGNDYSRWMTSPFDIRRPMRGMGIGKQMQYLTREIDDANDALLIGRDGQQYFAFGAAVER
mgnify:CR=1 FL=1